MVPLPGPETTSGMRPSLVDHHLVQIPVGVFHLGQVNSLDKAEHRFGQHVLGISRADQYPSQAQQRFSVLSKQLLNLA